MRKILDYIVTGEVLTVLLIVLAVAFILSMVFGAVAPKFRKKKWKYLLYVLVLGVIVIGFGAILYNLKSTTLNARFISFQGFMLLIGTGHLIFFHKFFKRFETRKIYKEIFFAFVTCLYVAVFMIVVIAYFAEFQFVYYMFGSLLLFLVPTLVLILFETAITIPARLYKRWFYPLNNKYPNPQITEMRNVILLNLVFHKKPNDRHIINFKVKAPRAMEFGRLFYYFINDYNDKHPNSQIHFTDAKNEPYGWYFHSRPKWFGSTNHIDPEESVDSNDMKDGDTIICQRI
ncbi:TssN family type VI secretion system protein [Sinomicrobium kalidii]|uniref:TssN family type VI secretion system protein n=1 Tax=Sinomicrobium kalidii TaxID=2900738 RepID=UPI001E4F7D68|nr:TssN family type VI secretion system protein [Sinomicrobium kalidii]UGU17169.1 TssN family type VI secretion system protein [Sinomicrobium kalidii]